METDEKRIEDLLRKMYAEDRATNDIDTSDIIDEEWHKFEAEHFSTRSPRREAGELRLSFLKKLAAMFVGVLILSGIAYAALHVVRKAQQTPQAVTTTVVSDSVRSAAEEQLSEPDSIPQVRVFENVPLDKIAREIGACYQKTVVIQGEQAHELRLYYKWDPKETLESVVADLNHFDRVNLTIENDKLIVNP